MDTLITYYLLLILAPSHCFLTSSVENVLYHMVEVCDLTDPVNVDCLQVLGHSLRHDGAVHSFPIVYVMTAFQPPSSIHVRYIELSWLIAAFHTAHLNFSSSKLKKDL